MADQQRDQSDANDDDDDDDAYGELDRLAEEEQRRSPGMSKEAAFAKVFSDPANRAVAARERRRSRRKMGVQRFE